jgi:hypothetical protein
MVWQRDNARGSGRRSVRSASFVIACLAFALTAHNAPAQATFAGATIDSTGQLRVRLANRIIQPAKDSDQVAFEQVALSADHRVVGWVALHPNCCTSYPIPLRLVLLRADGRRTVIGNELPIWQWGFASDGRSVVIRQSPVHGAAPSHYERRDVLTGRVLATAEADSSTLAKLPAWAQSAMPRQIAKPPELSKR